MTANEVSGMTIKEALNIKHKDIVSLIGAGGKTTIMFSLGKELSCEGKKVITTTTTKIYPPLPEESSLLLLGSEEEILKEFRTKTEKDITVAIEKLDNGKLRGISPDFVEVLSHMEEIDCIIVEADGSQGRPLKAPSLYEPVIPSCSTLVVTVIGVEAVGSSLDEGHVFRWQIFSQLTGLCHGDRLDARSIAVSLFHKDGLLRDCPKTARVVPFINKVDGQREREKAKGLADEILKSSSGRVDYVICGRAKKKDPVAEIIGK